jgi:putative transport protein
MPVAYAVSYLLRHAGSAWVLATLGPKILRVNLAEECAKYEKDMGAGAETVGQSAYARFVVRAYQVVNPKLLGQRWSEWSNTWPEMRVFVLRVREGIQIVDANPDTVLTAGSVVAVVGRRRVLVEAGPASAQKWTTASCSIFQERCSTSSSPTRRLSERR